MTYRSFQGIIISMSDKKAIPTKLLWVDLEMTGLNVTKDVILEVAAEVTDFEFETLASYEAMVKQPRELVLDRMQNDPQNKVWWDQFPGNRNDFLSKLESGKPSEQAEQDLIAFVEANFGDEPAILAGNSIHNDRNFIKQWWPELDKKLHYRMLDVSAFKVFMEAKHGVVFEKKGAHRAFDDIQASIAELQHYLEWFKKNES